MRGSSSTIRIVPRFTLGAAPLCVSGAISMALTISHRLSDCIVDDAKTILAGCNQNLQEDDNLGKALRQSRGSVIQRGDVLPMRGSVYGSLIKGGEKCLA